MAWKDSTWSPVSTTNRKSRSSRNYALHLALSHLEGGSGLQQALGRDLKGENSPALNLAGSTLAFVNPGLAMLVITSDHHVACS